LGNWFDKDYDVHGPAGPTAFWKVSDDIQEEKPRGMNPHAGGGLGGAVAAAAIAAGGINVGVGLGEDVVHFWLTQ
jgi:hypothetical protein